MPPLIRDWHDPGICHNKPAACCCKHFSAQSCSVSRTRSARIRNVLAGTPSDSVSSLRVLIFSLFSPVYLPVSVPGALLYIGDGHAAQGDGELNGNALETSMDVEFTVDVIPKKRISSPRVESATHIMAMGLEGSLDEAFRSATSSMAKLMADDYELTLSEIAQALGTSAEYRVSEVADRNAGIVLKINKERLQAFARAN